MLTNLRVKNLALVEEAGVVFRPGLNVITGETGAGKSVLIGALAILLGERMDRGQIRSGAEECSAEALFDLADPAPVNVLLEDLGLVPCEGGELLIRRVVKASGSSRNLVNDSPVTLQALKRLGELLMDMHGPYDHQSLLHRDAQLDILDAFGKLMNERALCAEAYRAWRDLQDRRAELEGGGEGVAEQVDLLAYRVKEIEDAALTEIEEEEIRAEHLVVGNAQRILELGTALTQALSEGEGSAFDTLASVRGAADELARLLPEAQTWQQELAQATHALQELSLTVSRELSRVEGDPARLDWLDARLALYAKLRKKYGPSVREVLDTLERSRQRLSDLQNREARLVELDREIAAAHAKIEKAAESLRAKRQQVADKLADAVSRELRELGFAHGLFSVSLSPCEPRATGMDEIEFGFAPNAGEPVRPLRAIASSGEISRVMLATKAVLARHDRVPVLVFDEIDANVGGEMGTAIGKKLAAVAKHHQVLCITHLPQVAVYGACHFAVSKSVREGRTYTRVVELGEDERVEELARMLGGRDLTAVTLTHSREMLKKAQKG